MDFNSLLKAMKERMLSEGDCYVINDIKQLELCFQQEDYYSILQLCKELNIKINVVPPPPLPPAHSPKYVPNEPTVNHHINVTTAAKQPHIWQCLTLYLFL